jgi:hypothetical protein
MEDKALDLVEFSQSTVYMMGISFVLGSLFTIFVLLLLDFMRRDKKSQDN